MIIREFDVVRVALAPGKADPPLPVHAHAPLPRTVAHEAFQPVAGNPSQVIETPGAVQLDQLALRSILNLWGKAAGELPAEDALRLLVPERADHGIYSRVPI